MAKYAAALMVVVAAWPASSHTQPVIGSVPGAGPHTEIVTVSGGSQYPGFAHRGGLMHVPGTGTSISLNLNMNFPLKQDASSDEREQEMQKAQHRMLAVFNRECDLLRSEFGSDCAVSQLNINASMNQGNSGAGDVSYVNAGVQGTFMLTPVQPPVSAPTP